MSKDYPIQERDIEAIREGAVEVLTEHFSTGVMDLEEFEDLLDAVNGCSTPGELRELLAKLPPLESSAPATDVIPAQGGGPVVVDADRVRNYGALLGILCRTTRSGRWIPARSTVALGVLAGLSLDFREAMLGPGITDLKVLTVLGGVDIIIPPGMAVDVDGMSLLGSFDHKTGVPLRANPDLPTLRVQGLAILGGVSVEVRLPGESSRQAKRRRRLERKGLQPRFMSGPED